MWMHLLNLKARTKENLNMENQLGRAEGSLIQKLKIKKKHKKHYGLAIPQNTLKKLTPTDREVDVTTYTMIKKKKKTL